MNKLRIKSFIVVLLVVLLTGGIAFFASHQIVHAQSDCVDPATGAACTPVPPPSGCTAADGCTPVPPPPSRPKPSKTPTPRPLPTRTSTSTVTETATATATATNTPTSTSTATPLPLNTATTAPVNQVKPYVPPPNPVTPKSQKNPWGWVVDMVNWLFKPSTDYEYGTDVFWVGNIVAVQKTQGTCVGGSCLNGMAKAILAQDISVYVSPWSEWYEPGVRIPEILEEPLIVLCQGTTGRDGCAEPRYSSGKIKYYDDYLHLLGLPWGSQDITIPAKWLPKAGTYQFTAYVNYNQNTVPELVYHNNFKTFTVIVEAPTIKYGNISNLPTPTPTLEPSDNPYYFDDTLVVLQNGNCIQGCSLTPGWVIAGQPVEIYLRGMYQPYKSYSANYADPTTSAMFACKGLTGQNGCNDLLAVDAPPYNYPSWFNQKINPTPTPKNPIIVPPIPIGPPVNKSPSGYAHFTIPGEWIPSTGLYGVTFYVNYNQQAGPEVDMSDNTKTIYLNASALQQP
jgi:hypothetical protein